MSVSHVPIGLRLLASTVVLVTLGSPVGANAQTAYIPADTEVVIRTTGPINAREADESREYAAVLDEPLIVDGTQLAPKGADAVLRVVEATRASGVKGRASLTLQLTAVAIASRRVAVVTQGVKSEGGSQAGRAAKAGVGGAAIGAVLGGILGGKSGAAKGAAVGGGAAVGVVAVSGQRIQVPSETRLTFVLSTQTPLERP